MARTGTQKRKECSRISLVVEFGCLQIHGGRLIEEPADAVDIDREQGRKLLAVIFAATDFRSADKQRDLPRGRVLVDGVVAADGSNAESGGKLAGRITGKILQPARDCDVGMAY